MKPIKQIFSQEIKDKLKNVGDYAFIIDKNDYAIKVYDNKYIFISEHKGANHKLKLLNNNYNTKLHNLLKQVAELSSIDYSNQGTDGYTLYDAGTVLVTFENEENKHTINIPHTVLYIIDTTNLEPMFNKDINIEAIIFNEDLEFIGTNTFRELTNLRRVVLRPNVKEIRDSAFEACTNLENIFLSTSLKVIGNKAFYNTNIKEVTIPYFTEYIGSQAFANDQIEELEIKMMMDPKNIEIESDSFDIPNLTNLTIYVADRYLEDFKQKFIKYSSNIKPISEKEYYGT